MITREQYIEAKKVVDTYKKQEIDKLQPIKDDINDIFEDLKKVKPVISPDGNYPMCFWAEIDRDYHDNYYIQLCGFDSEYYQGEYDNTVKEIRDKYPNIKILEERYSGK